jgi:glycosyltransferase involved in cell wall biosynthesis
MAVHNGLPYVRETLDDLLAQTLTDFELIVVDDASEDDTPRVLDEFAERDDRIRVIRNESNLGLPAALNRGLDHCSAPLTARADADDRYPPHRLERQVEFMDRHPDVGLLSCALHKIDENGTPYTTSRYPTQDGAIRMRELFVNSFSHPGAMFRTKLVKELGGYDPDYLVAQDADLWARLRARTRAANLAEPLVHYRVLDGSLMRSPTEERRNLRLSVRQRLLSDYLRRPLTLDETRRLVRVFHASPAEPPSPDDLAAARSGFREVLRAARRRESAETRRYFRQEVAAAYLRHYRFAAAGGSGPDRVLLLEALRWDPRLLRSGYVARETVKALLPRPVTDQLRRWRARLKFHGS